MAAVGVDGVNIHTFNKALYEPFSFTHSSGGWQAHVDPMYYGMLMFARAAPTGSRLLSTNAASSRALRIWAIRAPDGTVRVAVINDSPTRTLVLAVRPPRTSVAATLERLTAPTLESRTGVTIAGQTFGAATTTGELTRSYKTTTLQPIQHRYVVELPPASAALLSVRALRMRQTTQHCARARVAASSGRGVGRRRSAISHTTNRRTGKQESNRLRASQTS